MLKCKMFLPFSMSRPYISHRPPSLLLKIKICTFAVGAEGVPDSPLVPSGYESEAPPPNQFLNTFSIMAVSKTGGAFGYLHKKLGGMVYSAPKLGINQERVQVVRTQADTVSNPNTVSQIMQRMKLGAATRFFSAYENFVSKGLMSHSFESVKYGNPSRLYFLQKALKEEAAVYVPNGIDYFVPGEYLVSEGTIQSLPWRVELTAAPAAGKLFQVGTAITAANVQALSTYNIVEGDQITIMGAVHRNGRYFPAAARVIVRAGEVWNYSAAEWTNILNQVQVFDTGVFPGASLGELTLAGLAVIISRGTNETNDARSTEFFLLVNGYKSLKSPEALQAAINSYLEGVSYNSLNSDWYLNQGRGQAFDGRVQLSDMLGIPSATGGDISAEIFIGVQQSETQGGLLVYTVFTSDGTAAGQAWLHNGNNELVPATFDDGATPVTGSDVAAVMSEMGYGSQIRYFAGTAAIAAQGGFTLGA